MEEYTPVKGILHNQVWSMSKIKTLKSCPLNFYLSYIRKLRVDYEPDVLERDLGTTIHYLLEMMMSGMTIQEAYEITLEKYGDVIPHDSWHRVIGMLPSVRKFNGMMHEKDLLNNYELAEPELMLAVDRDFNPVDFRDPSAYFRGVVDLTCIAGDEATVIDYKKGGGGYLTKYHSPQLSSYLLLSYYCIRKFKESKSYIYYVESEELSPGPSIEGPRIESHTRKWIENEIESTIKLVEDEGYFQYKRNNACKYCDYQKECKSGKRGTSGTLAKYEIESKGCL